VTFAMTRPVRLDLESFARATGLHPDMVRRLVALGLLDAKRDRNGELWFAPAEVAAAARLQRLRAGRLAVVEHVWDPTPLELMVLGMRS